MKIENAKSLIESMLFAAGRVVTVSEMAKILEMTPDEVEAIVNAKSKRTARALEVIWKIARMSLEE